MQESLTYNENMMHVHSMYSLFDSTATPEEIVAHAKEMGIKNITLTDHGTMLGIDPFMDAGEKYGVNTIPGVEMYLEGRRHLLVIAKDYEGYQSLAHAMKSANMHIESMRKLKFPILVRESLEQAFKDNRHVIATSACIQGPVASILLENHRRRKKIAKEEGIYAQTAPMHEQWEAMQAALKIVLEELSLAKKERTEHTRYLKPAYIKKTEEMKAKLADIPEGSKNHLKVKNRIELRENAQSMASDLMPGMDKQVKNLEAEKNRIREKLSSLDKYNKMYLKSEKKIGEMQFAKEEDLYQSAKNALLYYKSIFPEFYVELQYHGLDEEAYVMPLLVRLARETRTPLIAANDAHMIDGSEESITARKIIRFNYFERSQGTSSADRTLYMKSPDELRQILADIVGEDAANEAVHNLVALGNCSVKFPSGEHYPVAKSDVSFDKLLEEARAKKIAAGEWNEIYEERLRYESGVIKQMGYEDYHMIVRDFCNEARRLGAIPREELAEIPEDFNELHAWMEEKGYRVGVGIGPGRGSAVGSLVCYLLGITNIDPIRYNLLFERFLNPERVSMPDIDTDIRTSIRPLAIRYVKWKYKDTAVCSIATESTFGAKGAIQMAGRERADELFHDVKPASAALEKKRNYMATKALRMSDMIPAVPGTTLADSEEEILQEIGGDSEMELIWEHAKMLEGKLYGTGIHAGGIVISDNDDINDYVPLAWNEEVQVWSAQCNMEHVERKGLLKVDLLGLNTLDIIDSCVHMILKTRGTSVDIDNIPFEKEVFDQIYSTGCTNSVFQFESEGMKAMLRRFQPSCIEDLILLVACYRPGPMQYLDNIIEVARGRKKAEYLLPELKPILQNTYGGVVYQEQVMQIFQKLAGYSLGQADLVRRAMSKKKMDKLAVERKSFIYGDEKRGIAGCAANGIDKAKADILFNELTEFAKYAFNKSHATSYAVLSYIMAWLKYHYPAEFLCSMFNNKANDKYGPIIADCRLYGIRILPPSVNRSGFEFTIGEDGQSIRYGFTGIKGIGAENAEFFMNSYASACNVPYRSFQSFLFRNTVLVDGKIKLPGKKIIESLIRSGAFDEVGDGREALEEFYVSIRDAMTANETMETLKARIQSAEIPDISKNIYANMRNESELLGVIVSENPLEKFENDIKYGCIPVDQIEDSNNVAVLGLVVSLETKKSRKGNDMLIVELQGLNGTCTVFFMNTLYERYASDPGKLENHVIKVRGSSRDGRILANSMTFLDPGLQEYSMRMDNPEKTRTASKFLKNGAGGHICLHIECWYLVNRSTGELKRSERPVYAKKMVSDETIRELMAADTGILRYDPNHI